MDGRLELMMGVVEVEEEEEGWPGVLAGNQLKCQHVVKGQQMSKKVMEKKK